MHSQHGTHLDVEYLLDFTFYILYKIIFNKNIIYI